MLEFYGDIEDEGDVDIYAYDFSKDSAGSFYQWSLWPMDFGTLVPEMRLYNDSWELLASTADPSIYPGSGRLDDVGVAYRVPDEGGRLYMEISNADTTSGVGTFYAGMILGYTSTLGVGETEENDFPGFANEVAMTESTTTPGYFFGSAWGVLEGGEDVDNWKVLASDVGGSLDGQYLSVYVQAEQIGSLLDAKLVIYAEDAETILAEETINPVNSSADPEVWDIQLDDLGAVYISIESESVDDSDLANGYLLTARTHSEPIN